MRQDDSQRRIAHASSARRKDDALSGSNAASDVNLVGHRDGRNVRPLSMWIKMSLGDELLVRSGRHDDDLARPVGAPEVLDGIDCLIHVGVDPVQQRSGMSVAEVDQSDRVVRARNSQGDKPDGRQQLRDEDGGEDASPIPQ